jgi:hypothetical protein
MTETQEQETRPTSLFVGHVSYRGENTQPGAAVDCREPVRECTQHYVVRIDGTWVRAFHDEGDADYLARALQA